MRELPRWLVAPNAAGAVEMRAGFNHQLPHRHFSDDFACRHDFQPVGVNVTVESTADQHAPGADPAFHMPGLADGDLGLRLDVAVDTAVDVQVVF